MPRGAKPGERRGGRLKGSKNKATIEREIIAEQTLARARMEGKKLGKEILEEFMIVFAGRAAHYQPRPPELPPNPNADEAKFLAYARLATDCAKSLAPYQSPTFRAIAVEHNNPQLRSYQELPLNSFDEHREVIDPIEAAKVYQRLMVEIDAMQRKEDDVGDRRRHDLRKAIDPFETEKTPLSNYGGCRDGPRADAGGTRGTEKAE
jgi:hypothetical protein